MKHDAFDQEKYEDYNFETGTTFERIKRRRPDKDEETRSKGRKFNHRTKKKKESDI
ncbi:hypothetical protein [Rossellomorea marisflavi]|uniref:hypothetical protein n=1 Tax=Rossellomorea marisflavi TaxID=189381 RepID=UPI003F9F32CD